MNNSPTGNTNATRKVLSKLINNELLTLCCYAGIKAGHLGRAGLIDVLLTQLEK